MFAVNLSVTQETAIKESGANFTYYNFAPSDVRPKILVGVRLKLRKVIDLTNLEGVGQQPWLRLDELLAEDWRNVNDAGHESQSRALGRAAHDLGAEGLLVPSASDIPKSEMRTWLNDGKQFHLTFAKGWSDPGSGGGPNCRQGWRCSFRAFDWGVTLCRQLTL